MNITITAKLFENNEIIYEIPLTFRDDVLESMLYGDEIDETEISPTSIKYWKKEILNLDEMEILKSTIDEDTMTGKSGLTDSSILLDILEKYQGLLDKKIYACFVSDFVGKKNVTDVEYLSDKKGIYIFEKYFDLIASINQLIGILKVTKESEYQIQLESSFT
jgi:hypothetical protein